MKWHWLWHYAAWKGEFAVTYEYAEYFRLLLICGYQDELWQYIDDALVAQDPLSDIVLELSTAGSDDKKLLAVLEEYLRQVNDSDIDYDHAVFDHVMSFLKRKYLDDAMSVEDVTELMYRFAKCSERYLDEPWFTMYYMSDLLNEAKAGFIDKEDYQRKFEAFLNDHVCLRDYPILPRKENFWKRIMKKIRKKD